VQTLDLRKSLKDLYSPSAKKAVEVEVPEMSFLMIDGRGDPASTSYHDAMMALYALAYTLKFSYKKAGVLDYPVMPLEGLWWAEDMAAFTEAKRDAWLWTSMIMLPDQVTAEAVEEAREEAGRKKRLPALPAVRLERFQEGRAAQIMHIGPYSEEGPTIARLHEFIRERGAQLRGKHHEIYLGDPRRTAPDRLKTVIRQPF
jgi:hypothetical protein